MDRFNAHLSFPLRDERLPSGLHIQTEVLHHAVNAVVQCKTSRLGLDGLSADGALLFLFAPLIDAMATEAMSTVQDDSLKKEEKKRVLLVWYRLTRESKRERIGLTRTSMKSSEQIMH